MVGLVCGDAVLLELFNVSVWEDGKQRRGKDEVMGERWLDGWINEGE